MWSATDLRGGAPSLLYLPLTTPALTRAVRRVGEGRGGVGLHDTVWRTQCVRVCVFVGVLVCGRMCKVVSRRVHRGGGRDTGPDGFAFLCQEASSVIKLRQALFNGGFPAGCLTSASFTGLRQLHHRGAPGNKICFSRFLHEIQPKFIIDCNINV